MKMCNVVAFAGGVLAGGVIALLFAPKRGKELRDGINDKLDDVKRCIGEAIDRHCDGCRCSENNNSVVKE